MIPLSVLINPTNLSAYLSNFAFASHPVLGWMENAECGVRSVENTEYG